MPSSLIQSLSSKYDEEQILELGGIDAADGYPLIEPTSKQMIYYLLTTSTPFTVLIGQMKRKLWKDPKEFLLEGSSELAQARDNFQKLLEVMLVEGVIEGGKLCRVCKKETAYARQAKQTRSGDEQMTIFHFCPSCKSEWRT